MCVCTYSIINYLFNHKIDMFHNAFPSFRFVACIYTNSVIIIIFLPREVKRYKILLMPCTEDSITIPNEEYWLFFNDMHVRELIYKKYHRYATIFRFQINILGHFYVIKSYSMRLAVIFTTSSPNSCLMI
jgi:hypothetical protein